MKEYRRKSFSRLASSLAKTTKGCMSATCPFRSEKDGAVGMANVCICGETARGIANQLSKELKAEGM